MIAAEPAVFFRPPYVGHRGWVGVRLDLEDVNWEQVRDVVREAFRTVAPSRLAALV
jgi:hypothetical protein